MIIKFCFVFFHSFHTSWHILIIIIIIINRIKQTKWQKINHHRCKRYQIFFSPNSLSFVSSFDFFLNSQQLNLCVCVWLQGRCDKVSGTKLLSIFFVAVIIEVFFWFIQTTEMKKWSNIFSEMKKKQPKKIRNISVFCFCFFVFSFNTQCLGIYTSHPSIHFIILSYVWGSVSKEPSEREGERETKKTVWIQTTNIQTNMEKNSMREKKRREKRFQIRIICTWTHRWKRRMFCYCTPYTHT